MTAMSPLIRSARMLSVEDVGRALEDLREVLHGRAMGRLLDAALDDLSRLSEERRTAPPPPGVERDPPELVEAIQRLRENYKRIQSMAGGGERPPPTILTERTCPVCGDLIGPSVGACSAACAKVLGAR